MSTPDYLAHTVPCPLHPGKSKRVVAFAHLRCRQAAREAVRQWQYFMCCIHASEFQSAASTGWTRPWVTSGSCVMTLGQQIMAHVVGQLKDHIGQTETTFRVPVAHRTLSDNDKHQLTML
jgi:hypothetical protein